MKAYYKFELEGLICWGLEMEEKKMKKNGPGFKIHKGGMKMMMPLHYFFITIRTTFTQNIQQY